MKYIKLFDTDSERVLYEDSENYIEPYVSYVEGDNTVHYNKPEETKLVVYYDIQDISAPTTIFTNYDNSVKSIEVDGKETINEFSLGNVTYQFDSVGEHVVKFEFNNPTVVGGSAPLLYQLLTVKRVVIPDTFTAIGSNAFNSCGKLTSVVIPDSVTSIGNNAFNSCSGLTSVIIGSGVTSIGRGGFSTCNNLFTITSHIMNAPSVNPGTFAYIKSGGTLYVPIGSSGYETWMNDQGNLGLYGWTKVEQL